MTKRPYNLRAIRFRTYRRVVHHKRKEDKRESTLFRGRSAPGSFIAWGGIEGSRREWERRFDGAL